LKGASIAEQVKQNLYVYSYICHMYCTIYIWYILCIYIRRCMYVLGTPLRGFALAQQVRQNRCICIHIIYTITYISSAPYLGVPSLLSRWSKTCKYMYIIYTRKALHALGTLLRGFPLDQQVRQNRYICIHIIYTLTYVSSIRFLTGPSVAEQVRQNMCIYICIYIIYKYIYYIYCNIYIHNPYNIFNIYI